MVSKKILGSGIAVSVIISAMVGMAIYNGYLNFEDIFEDSSNKRTITDSLGRKVKIPDADDIKRILGINPGCLRLLIYMEAEDKICGVEEIEIFMRIQSYQISPL
jgi:ABC-type Fe3+-hydroxamate transport system substrate-binding protein